MHHSLPACFIPSTATLNSNGANGPQLDRLYQRIADDLDQLLNALGQARGLTTNENKIPVTAPITV